MMRFTWLLGVLSLTACASCPPAWSEAPPERVGFLHAAAGSGDTFVDANAERVALIRATRQIADELGLDVERRLSVIHADGRLWVEALGPEGLVHDLDGLELVSSVVCGDRTWVLVRLPWPPESGA